MNEIAKNVIREKLLKAIKNENITQRAAAMFLGIGQHHVSVIKTQNPDIKVPDDIWEKVRAWTNSGYTLKQYPFHHSEMGSLKVDPVADALWQQSVDNVNKAKEALKAVIEKGELNIPENISEGIPASDNEITDPEFEEEIPIGVRLQNDFEELKRQAIYEFVQNNSSKIITGEYNEYYFMPYWFRETGGVWELHHLDKLPVDLKHAIKAMRGE